MPIAAICIKRKIDAISRLWAFIETGLLDLASDILYEASVNHRFQNDVCWTKLVDERQHFYRAEKSKTPTSVSTCHIEKETWLDLEELE